MVGFGQVTTIQTFVGWWSGVNVFVTLFWRAYRRESMNMEKREIFLIFPQTLTSGQQVVKLDLAGTRHHTCSENLKDDIAQIALQRLCSAFFIPNVEVLFLKLTSILPSVVFAGFWAKIEAPLCVSLPVVCKYWFTTLNSRLKWHFLQNLACGQQGKGGGRCFFFGGGGAVWFSGGT